MLLKISMANFEPLLSLSSVGVSGSYSIDFKRSRIRPEVIKINTFKLETSICNHFADAQVCVSFMFFSLSGKINLRGKMLVLYFYAVFFGLVLNIYGVFR